MSRILVIDDEDVIRALVMEILETAGHEITGAESAEGALALLEDDEFDLVVSDVIMPGPLRPRAARGRAVAPRLAARGARHGRRHLRHAEPGADAWRGRARHQAVRPRRAAGSRRRRARALCPQPRGPEGAAARADARIRARERDRGTRLVPARPLRAPRRARGPPRRAARAAGRRGRDDPPRRDPARHRQDRHPGPRAPEACRAGRRRAPDHRDAPGDRRQAARAAGAARRRAADRPPPSRALGRRRLPGPPRRRRDPARRAHRRRRRLRRGDVVPPALPRSRAPPSRSSASCRPIAADSGTRRSSTSCSG